MNFIQRRAHENFRSKSTSNRIDGLNVNELDKNKKYHCVVLSPHYLDVRAHFIKGQAPAHCNLIYFEDGDEDAVCEDCKKPHPKYKTQPAYLSRLYVVRMLEFPIKVNRNGKEWELKPTTVLALPGKGKKMFFKPFMDAAEEDVLLSSIFNIEVDKENGLCIPSIFQGKREKLGDAYNEEEVKADQAMWLAKSEAEVLSVEFNIYNNAKWDHPDMVELGMKNPADAVSETTEETQGEVKADMD